MASPVMSESDSAGLPLLLLLGAGTAVLLSDPPVAEFFSRGSVTGSNFKLAASWFLPHCPVVYQRQANFLAAGVDQGET